MMIRPILRYSALGVLALVVSCATAGADTPPETAPLDCGALPGTQDLLDERSETYLVFGEIHGTSEAPQAFGEIVCEAAARGPVIVGIERPSAVTPVLQTYLDSDGGNEARFALLRGFFDGTEWGLSSQAFLDLFIRLRQIRQAGADIKLVGFTNEQPIGSGGQTPYEKRLAKVLKSAGDANPDARVMVLVGNLHARKEPYPTLGDRPGFDPMAMHLPDGEVLSFNISHAGGEAHLCAQDGCGPHPVEGRPRLEEPALALSDSDSRYDGVWYVGPVTASPPIGTRYK